MWETKLNASRALQTTNESESGISNSGGLRLPIAKETTNSKNPIDIKAEMVY
jgi:hypothetical protein